MFNSLFTKNHWYVLVLVIHVFAFVSTGQAQTIGTPTVSGAPVCAGSSVNVSFVVTNGKGNDNGQGNGKEKYFTTATDYTLNLYRNDTLISTATQNFNSSIAPADTGGASETINYTFPIPLNSPFSTNYQVEITSISPAPTGNASQLLSLAFEVHATIANNTISGDQLGCNPYTAVPIAGSAVTGGNGIYGYIWESSTTGPTNGFSVAPGTSNTMNYDPGVLTETTWFRRTVNSGMCTSISNTVKVTVINENKWTGAIDQDWNNPGNWSCGAIPIPVTNVVVPPTANDPILELGSPGTANNIDIQAGASLTVKNNALSIGGSISKAGTGTLDAKAGKFIFVGNAPQSFSGSLLVENKLKDLVSDNPAGLILNDTLKVTGAVLASTGNITSNGNLVLISSATGTALIDGSGTGEIIGDVTVQRYLSTAYGYKYFSSPFTSLSVGDFQAYMDLTDPTTGFPNFYNYNENRQSNGSDASGWEIYTDPAGPLEPGKGYAVNFGADAVNPLTVAFTGTVFNSTLVVPVENNNGLYTQGFNLVGNPYPSPISWGNVGRTNVDDAIYFFTAGSTDPYTGTYSSYVNGVSNDGLSSGIVPSMQGFFVKVTDPADGSTPVSGSLQFDAGSRVNDFSQEFYKKPKQGKSSWKLIRLQAGFRGPGKKDAQLIYFPEDAKSGFESDKDALEIFNTDPTVPSFYSLAEDHQQLSINSLPYSRELYIGLGVRAEKKGVLLIELTEIQGLPEGSEIQLIDTEKGISTVLKANQPYTCQINQGDHEGRFFLSVASSKELEKEILNTELGLFTSFTREGKLFVDLNLNEAEKGVLQVSNLQGQVLEERGVSGKQRVSFPELSTAGIYIITLYHQGSRTSSKVIIEK